MAPYHDGAIKYYKEVGKWNDDAQAHNDRLVSRQGALAKAWADLKAKGSDNWAADWDAARRKALADGGFEVVF